MQPSEGRAEALATALASYLNYCFFDDGERCAVVKTLASLGQAASTVPGICFAACLPQVSGLSLEAEVPLPNHLQLYMHLKIYCRLKISCHNCIWGQVLKMANGACTCTMQSTLRRSFTFFLGDQLALLQVMDQTQKSGRSCCSPSCRRRMFPRQCTRAAVTCCW